MARSDQMDEVRVLQFFETGSIDKVEAVFNIVCEEMRERLRGRAETESVVPRKRRASRSTDDSDTSLNRTDDTH